MTDKLYLINPDVDECNEDHLLIVKAASKEEAVGKYGLWAGIKEEWFLDFVYDCWGVDGFAFQLWRTGRGDIEQVQRPTSQEFRKKVGVFFGDRADFAEMYFAYYRDDQMECIFPDEMLLYVWQHAEWHGIRAFLLDDIARLD